MLKQIINKQSILNILFPDVFSTIIKTEIKKTCLSLIETGFYFSRILFVRMKGLEPTRLSAPDPKSGSATNYDTSANRLQIYENSNNGNIIFTNKLKLLYLERGYLYSFY